VTPVRTDESDLVYRGPTPEIRDLHCHREQLGVITSVWWLTPDERAAIAAGANLRLTIATEPIPPVTLELTDVQGIGEDAPDVLERLDHFRRGVGQ
jgi:hypothetical protein